MMHPSPAPGQATSHEAEQKALVLAARRAMDAAVVTFIRASAALAVDAIDHRNAIILAGRTAHNDVGWYVDKAMAADESPTRHSLESAAAAARRLQLISGGRS